MGDDGIITETQWGSFSSEMQNVMEKVQTEQIKEAVSGVRNTRKVFVKN